MLALLLTLALAQPTTTGGTCGPGKVCTARRFVSTSTASAPTAQFCESNNVNAFSLVRSANTASFQWSATCSSGGTAFPLSFNSTSGVVDLGSSTPLTFTGFSAPTSLSTTPTFRGIASDFTTHRMWRANTSRWTEIAGGLHPVTESPTYTYVMDRGAGAFAPVWEFAPRSGGAAVAFTSAGTLTSGSSLYSEPFASYATTAVSGNQAHHSTAVCVGPATRWSARVGFGSLASFTNTRAFFGLSATLPLTAGSSTPTADAAVFRADTSVGSTWFACTSDGSAALSCTDTGVAVAFASEISNTLEIDCREADAVGFATACTFWINGRPYVRRTTSLPNASVGATASVETLTASSRAFYLGTAVSLEPALKVTP